MAINATTAATIINLTNERLGHLADELGTLREQIRSLQAREGEVAKAIRESCAEVTQGVLFRVSVKRRSQRTLDTTALRKTLPEAVWAPFLRASEQIRLETSRLA